MSDEVYRAFLLEPGVTKRVDDRKKLHALRRLHWLAR